MIRDKNSQFFIDKKDLPLSQQNKHFLPLNISRVLNNFLQENFEFGFRIWD
jgi:hypothetical protein